MWGDAIAHLDAPDFEAPNTPTPHPLANALGALASVFGEDASKVMMVVAYLAFAGLGLAAYLVGRRSFGITAGVAFAAILLTRPLLVFETLQAAIDVPFLALVLAALAAELKEERRPTLVLALLALAGLLRPEAWLLSAAYFVYARGGARAALLAVSAPVVWLLHDLVLTGDALHSLRETRELATTLERERGLASAVDVLPDALEAILRSGVVWTGLVVGAVALFVAQDRVRLPMAVLALGLLGFLVLGVAELPLLIRYLLVPAAMLALFCAAGLAGFAWLPRFGVLASAAVAVVLAAGSPATKDALDERTGPVAAARASESSLDALADEAKGLVEGCRPLRATTYGAVAVLAYRLGVEPWEIGVGTARRGLVFVASPEAVAAELGPRALPAEDLPPGFRVVATDGAWTLGALCP